MQKMKQFRRLKLEEVKVLAEDGIELNAAEYQRQVEEREAQRKKDKEARLAREAMMTLEALEREEQQAAEAAAKVIETPAVEGEAEMKPRIYVFRCFTKKLLGDRTFQFQNSFLSPNPGFNLMQTFLINHFWLYLSFCYLSGQEQEAKPQNLTDDTEKKKQRRPKKMSSVQNLMTGFEEAFEQFAKPIGKNSKKATASHIDTLSPRHSDISADSKMDVSATQVSPILTESQ